MSKVYQECTCCYQQMNEYDIAKNEEKGTMLFPICLECLEDGTNRVFEIVPEADPAFDSFMYSSFQIGFCKLLLRVINFSFSGFGTSLLLRSSVASPGPVTLPPLLHSSRLQAILLLVINCFPCRNMASEYFHPQAKNPVGGTIYTR